MNSSTDFPKTSKSYLPRDYRKVGWDRRSLAMKTIETSLGQPMEEILCLLWWKYRRIYGVSKALGISTVNIGRWLQQLGLYICIGCSLKTGKLFVHTSQCRSCGRWFCDKCLERADIGHKTPVDRMKGCNEVNQG